MKKVMQKYLYNGKQKGDCWRACIASILEVDIDLLPDPNVITDWPTLYTETLIAIEKLGYKYESLPVSISRPDYEDYIIAIGKSPRSKSKRVTHAVVWKNGMIHDPHPDGMGLLDITRFEYITKLK